MFTVERFAGLKPHTWTSASLVENSHLSHVTSAVNPETEFKQAVIDRLIAFYKRIGSKYYDHVSAHNFFGCYPDE